MNTFTPKDKKRAYFGFGALFVFVGILQYLNPPENRPVGFLSFYSRLCWDMFGPMGIAYGRIALGLAFISAGFFLKAK